MFLLAWQQWLDNCNTWNGTLLARAEPKESTKLLVAKNSYHTIKSDMDSTVRLSLGTVHATLTRIVPLGSWWSTQLKSSSCLGSVTTVKREQQYKTPLSIIIIYTLQSDMLCKWLAKWTSYIALHNTVTQGLLTQDKITNMADKTYWAFLLNDLILSVNCVPMAGIATTCAEHDQNTMTYYFMQWF